MKRSTSHLILPVAALLLASCANQSPIRVERGHENYHYQVDCRDASAMNGKTRFDEIRHALEEHIISIDKKGRYRPLRYTLNCGGKSVKGEQPARLGALFDNISRTVTSKGYTEILLILHGGLVNERNNISEAILLHRAIERDPVLQQEHEKIYPIFINWRSGGWESYWDQLVNIRGGEEKPLLGRATAPFKLGSDLGGGIADTLYSAGLEGERLVDSLGSRLNACEEQTSSPRVICPTSQSSNKLEIISTLQYFLMMPVRIGTSPIINGFGRSAWENMVRQTRFLFRSEHLDKGTRGAINQLFVKLRTFTLEPERYSTVHGLPIRLSLIGHSMGSMIISEIVAAFPALPYRNIVFLGAAVSGRDFRNMVVPLLQSSPYPDLHFYSASLLPSNEAREMNYLGTLPSGSLLEWIDELYTDPPTFADRTFGKWVNVRQFKQTYPESARKRMTFRVFGNAPGEPRTHGGFNDIDNCFWRKSFWTNEQTSWPEHLAQCQAFLERTVFGVD